MITLEKVGNALKFTFSGNSLYLQDGTIEVPLNSLTLVTDTSDLATFKKSASNDIFVSAPYSELGMTKLELETWFKNNACSTGGGGGGGVTPQEVQTMIDESISGKADTSSVYTKSETSGATEIATALSGKQDTLSAGTGINIDSANTISGVYRGYLALDNPQSTINEYSGQLYVKAPWFDCAGSETGQTRFYLASLEDEYLFSFNPTTKQYELISYPQGKENDWQDYFTIEWDDDFELFKITTLQEVYSITDVGCSRLFRIGNQYNDYSFKYSGTTEDAFDGIVENFNNYIKTAYLYVTSNSLGITKNYDGAKQERSDIQLEEIDGSSGKLKPNIVVGTGVSAWTEVQLNGCCLIGVVGAPVFRMYGDTSDLSNFNKNSFNTQWIVDLDHYGSAYDSITWDGLDFVLNSNLFGNNGQYGTATVTYDDVQNILTIAYPLTALVKGYNDVVKVRDFYNFNYAFGTSITKFEYFGEVLQPLKPYIQETRAEVANKIPTSAITSAVTSASTNSEIPSAKAVYDAIGQGGDLTEYWTSAQTQSAITQAVSGKQDTLSAGTNITIVDNVISATGGGGTTYTAGRGIDITNDTISCALPIYNGSKYGITIGYNTGVIAPTANGQGAVAHGQGTNASGMFSHAEGNGSTASGPHSHAEGQATNAVSRNSHAEGFYSCANAGDSHAEGFYSYANAEVSHAEGWYVEANNLCEHSQGRYNVSSSASTTFGDSGNTLFSVGNGTANNARHNAFEIRQNGDIYCNNGTSDVKLQDYLQIKVVKITQAAYDALSPDYDNNVLYVIV